MAFVNYIYSHPRPAVDQADDEPHDPQQAAATSNAPSESKPDEAAAHVDTLTLDRAVTESELIQVSVLR